MKFVLAAFATAGASCLALLNPQSAAQSNLDRIKDYRNWHRATTNPMDMSPIMAMSCVGPPPWQNSAANPHSRKIFLVYVNSIGKAAMMKKGMSVFPNGTVIVKEKFDRGEDKRKPYYEWKSVSGQQIKKIVAGKPELLTVMYKEKGVWNYFAVSEDGKELKGDTAYCGKCHNTAKEQDFVFRSEYVPGAPYLKVRYR